MIILRFRQLQNVTFSYGKLYCNCHSSSIWGMLYVNSLNDAYTCDATYVPSKRNISCIWWKSYQDIVTNIVTDDSSVYCLSKLFAFLKRKELLEQWLIPT